MRSIISRFVLCIVGVMCAWSFSAQENVTTFGLQIKPMIPSKYFKTGPVAENTGNLHLLTSPKPSFNFGCVIRKGLTKMWSIETGINFVQRNYSMNVKHDSLKTNPSLNFRFINYEVPVQALIYVRLTDKLWMNASGGVSLDFYPSNIFSTDGGSEDSTFFEVSQHTYRHRWLQVSVLANYGFEYRTRDKGYFYVGASYHRPFNYIGVTQVRVIKDERQYDYYYELAGSYLTLDLRYFFSEKPETKKLKPKKN
jgi:hypothetical protein